MHSFNELCKKISHDIDSKDIRSRSRTEKEQIRFDYAVTYQLIKLWKKHFTHHDHESSIQKNKNYYSNNRREEQLEIGKWLKDTSLCIVVSLYQEKMTCSTQNT